MVADAAGVLSGWWRGSSHQPALSGHLPEQLQEWTAGLWGRQGGFGSPSIARLWPAPARRGFGQQQHSEASASTSTARLWPARSKQGFGQLEHSEASASYSKASASSSSQQSSNERLNNASPCCHEHGRRWRGSSQLLHRCRWICGSVGQKYQRDSAGIIPDIHCITQYW